MIFKKSKKGIFNKMLVCTAMLFAGVLASCGGGNNNSKPQGDVSTPNSGEVVDNTYAVTWDVAEHATVAVTGYESLPAKVEKGQTITFTISLDSGYEIGTVKANKTKLVEKNGSYSTKIAGATTITVTVLEQVEKVEVTTNPTKLTYFVGDAVDTTGMVVEVAYKTGRKETIEKGPEGYAISPATFIGGETEFTVIYGDYEVKVPLEQRVEFKVVIDPNGGTLSSTYLAKLAAFSLNNYEVSDKGVVSFTHYKDLTRPVTLPTKDDVTYENHIFLSWGTTATTISNDTTESIYAVAQWQAELVTITEASLVLENDTPYLIVKGTYKLADEVYLYLYEGNDKVSLKGDTYTNTGEAGAPLEVKFDLNRLVNAKTEDGKSYETKWMDIRFNAKLGEGQEESMEIAVDSITIDMSTKIKQGGHVFTFANYEGKLKVYYNTIHMEYSLRFGAEDGADGKKVDYLYIEGTTASDYYGKVISISWYAGSETEPDTSAIDAEGKFVVKVPLTKIPVKTDAFAHVKILASLEEGAEVLYGAKETNVLINNCLTELPATPDKPLPNSISYVGTDGVTAYAGNKWDGLMLYRQDESRSYQMTEVTLEKDDAGVIYYVIKGTSKGYTQDDLALYISFQHNSNCDGISWDTVWGEKEEEAAKSFSATLAEDGTFVVKVPVSTLLSEIYGESTDKWVLTVHARIAAEKTLSDVKVPIINLPLSDGKIMYSLLRVDGDGTGKTWNVSSLVMEPATAKQIITQSVDVAVVGEKVMMTISGSSMNYTKAELEALAVNFDFQENEVYTEFKQDDWTRHKDLPTVLTAQEDGTWTLEIDVTGLNPYLYTGHLSFGDLNGKDPADLKVPASFEKTVECNGKSYKVFEVAGSAKDYECWGCVAIEVATIEAAQ